MGTLVVGIALLAGIAYVAVRPLVERRVIAEAKARGVVLVIGGLGFDWSSVHVDDARFELIGVRGLSGKIDRIDVGLDGTTPTRVALTAPQVLIEADPLALMNDLKRFREQFPGTVSAAKTGGPSKPLPIGATNLSLSWKVPSSKWFDLNLMGATAAYAEPTASIVGANATLNGKPVGPLGLYVDAMHWLITLGFDQADPRAAPVRIDLVPDATAPSVKLALAKAPLPRLLATVGASIPEQPIGLSGTAELTTGPNWSGEAKGTSAFTIEGFVPPHPVELDAFVFGTTTTTSTNLWLSADHGSMRLEDVRVRAGAFALAGKGTLQQVDDHGTLDLGLQGDLGCGALADAAAHAHLGAIVGEWVGNAARENLKGSVHVWVRVTADTRDIAHARVARSIGIGCGLKPLAPPDPNVFGTLSDLTKKLPQLPEMPPMPDLGPGFIIPNGPSAPAAPASAPGPRAQ